MARPFDPKAKAKRQKIIAAIGGVILVALLVWRVPQVIALMNEKPPPPPAVSTTPAPTPVPGLPAAPGAPSASSALIDTDVPLAPEDGQLVSFGRFVSKDPFAQQIGATKTGTGSAAPGKPRKPVKTSEPELELQPVAPPKPDAPAAPSAAQISVNGKSETVASGASFPTADPIFKLVSIGKGSAKIAIEDGSYASGASTITLKKGHPLTLVNTADGTRYRLSLL